MQRPKRPGRYHPFQDDSCNYIRPLIDDMPRPGTPTPDPRQLQAPWSRAGRFLFKCNMRRRGRNEEPSPSWCYGREFVQVPLEMVPMGSSIVFKPEQAQPPRPDPPQPPLMVYSPAIPSGAARTPSPSGSKSKDELLSRLLTVLECPVCFEYMSPPILQCREGHLVCSGCRARLDLCPKCRQPFADFRARALEQVAEVLPYPCHNDGCNAQLLLSERQAHESTCLHRQYPCTLANCNWSGNLSALPKHMEQQHPESFIKSATHEVLLTILPNMMQDEKTFLMQCHNEIFHCVMGADCRQDIFIGFVMLLGSREKAADYEFELKFKIDGPPYTCITIVRSTLEESLMHAGKNVGVNGVVVSFSTLREVMLDEGFPRRAPRLPVHIQVRKRAAPPLPPPPSLQSVIVMDDSSDDTTQSSSGQVEDGEVKDLHSKGADTEMTTGTSYSSYR